VSTNHESGEHPAYSPIGAFPEAAVLLDERGTIHAANDRFAELIEDLGRNAPGQGDSYVDLLRSTLGVMPEHAERIEDRLTYLAIEDAPGLAFVREVECFGDGDRRFHRIQMVQWGSRSEGRLLVMHVDVTEARKIDRRAELELELCRALSHTSGPIEGHLRAARVFGSHIGASAVVHVPVDARGRTGAAEKIGGTGFTPTRQSLEWAPESKSLVHQVVSGRAPLITAPGPAERALAHQISLDVEGVDCCAVPSVRHGQVEGVVLFYLARDEPWQREHVALFAGLLGVQLGDDLVDTRPSSVPPPMRSDFDSMASLASDTDAPVLLLGESGVGKTRLARVIHQRSRRKPGPFLDLNCAGLSVELLESELFGHERGSFTGAHARKVGLLEKAGGGTVLLDEVGELNLTVQAKLLKVIETRTFRRLGGDREIATDVRFIAATHRDLWAQVNVGAFREDLLYRLNVVQIAVPPLRESPWRIPVVAKELLAGQCLRDGKQLTLTPGAELLLMQQYWRGNIRELANVLARASLGAQSVIDERRVHFALGQTAQPGRHDDTGSHESGRLAQREKETIIQALEASAYNIKRTAQVLGIARSTLYDKVDRYELDLQEGRKRLRAHPKDRP